MHLFSSSSSNNASMQAINSDYGCGNGSGAQFFQLGQDPRKSHTIGIKTLCRQ